MTDTAILYTISELATICECSKQTIQKHIDKKQLINGYKSVNGKQAKAFELTLDDINDLKQLIANNKGIVNTSVTVEDVEHWRNKYYETNNLLEVTKERTKLLEDRQNSYFAERQELNTEIANLTGKIGTLNATVDFLKKSELSKILAIKCLSSALAILIMGAILKVFFM